MGVLNINVGILGHVDSGKTSLVKALSTVLSTASLDRNPQSRERGITLDLGFSSFTVAVPEHLEKEKYTRLQFTLVDCPGHSSLIRTIIGGAQIMDMIILVVDATKGMQAQTLECVVIGEAVMARGTDVIVVLNKEDLIPEGERTERLRQAQSDIASQLAGTKLSNASFVCCAAAVGGEKTAAIAPKAAWGSKDKGKRGERRTGEEKGVAIDAAKTKGGSEERSDASRTSRQDIENAGQNSSTIGVDAVAAELTQRARVPGRRASASLYFAFDHCFSVDGQGTIVTGTVLTGEVKVNQMIELPALRVQKKVKSMQMFRKPVSVARAGDRVGICLANLDAKLLERGVVTTPGSVRPISSAIAIVRKVPAFNGQCRSGAYCHVSLGHTTAMATAVFFGASELKSNWRVLLGSKTQKETTATTSVAGMAEELTLNDLASSLFPWEAEFEHQERLLGRAQLAGGEITGIQQDAQGDTDCLQYCHLAFHTPVITSCNSVVLGSRLDSTGPANVTKSGDGTGAFAVSEAGDGQCRIAFHGRLLGEAINITANNTIGGAGKAQGDPRKNVEFGTGAGQIKLFTEKIKTGVVFRIGAGSELAGGYSGGMVDVLGKDLFKKESNMSPFVGMILLTEHGSMGQIESAFGKGGRFKARFPPNTPVKVGDKLVLRFRKYVQDHSKRMHQSYLRKDLQRIQSQQDQPKERGATKIKQETYVDISSGASNTSSAGVDGREKSNLRDGIVDCIKDSKATSDGSCTAIVCGLFTQEEDIRTFVKQSMVVETKAGVKGHIKGPFGKLGKCKVEFAGASSVRAGDAVFVAR